MCQRTLHKKDWVNSSSNSRGNSYPNSDEPSREHKHIGQGKGRQQEHGHARGSRLPSANGEPQCKVRCGKWRMASIKRGPGDQRMRMHEIVSGRNVEAGFVPEKGKA